MMQVGNKHYEHYGILVQNSGKTCLLSRSRIEEGYHRYTDLHIRKPSGQVYDRIAYIGKEAHHQPRYRFLKDKGRISVQGFILRHNMHFHGLIYDKGQEKTPSGLGPPRNILYREEGGRDHETAYPYEYQQKEFKIRIGKSMIYHQFTLYTAKNQTTDPS